MEGYMVDETKLDALRSDVLDRIDQSERRFKVAFIAAVSFEALFLIAFLLLADLSNRMHLLLLIASVGTYGIVVLSIVALGAHLNRGVLRVLKAIEMLRK